MQEDIKARLAGEDTSLKPEAFIPVEIKISDITANGDLFLKFN